MLVITRRQNDRILFPNLGITIHVNRVEGKNVRLGIEAPRSVHVLRHELVDGESHGPTDREAPLCERLKSETQPIASQASRHRSRNRLNTALLHLGLLQRKLELGQVASEQIESQICEVIEMLEQVEFDLPQPAAAMRGGSPRIGSHRKRALLVDDDANERTLLEDYLKTCDYDVDTASDGQEALEYFSSHARPDVVLLDMMMPRLDGPATVREIRANPELQGLKLIAVSGLEPREAPVEVGPAGVDRWFTKPIRASVLVREIDRELTALV